MWHQSWKPVGVPPTSVRELVDSQLLFSCHKRRTVGLLHLDELTPHHTPCVLLLRATHQHQPMGIENQFQLRSDSKLSNPSLSYSPELINSFHQRELICNWSYKQNRNSSLISNVTSGFGFRLFSFCSDDSWPNQLQMMPMVIQIYTGGDFHWFPHEPLFLSSKDGWLKGNRAWSKIPEDVPPLLQEQICRICGVIITITTRFSCPWLDPAVIAMPWITENLHRYLLSRWGAQQGWSHHMTQFKKATVGLSRPYFHPETQADSLSSTLYTTAFVSDKTVVFIWICLCTRNNMTRLHCLLHHTRTRTRTHKLF